MAVYYAYDKTILGSTTTLNGKSIDYYNGIDNMDEGDIWRYSGEVFTHVVFERKDGAAYYNGDANGTKGEPIRSYNKENAAAEQSTKIDGAAKATRYDYSYSVTDGTKSYEIAVIDVDLNDSGNISSIRSLGENGYYLVFTGEVPPANTDLVFEKITTNTIYRSHSSLGGKVVCFAEGTLIETREGKVKIEELRVGSEVFTLDSGYQKILWIGAQTLTADRLSQHPHLRPIRIHAGALGVGMPARDLVVSPQHRILAKSKLVERMFKKNEILIAAKHLLPVPGVEVAMDMQTVTYWHFLFDRHQIVLSNGVPTESLFTGPEALKSVSSDARREILAIFPELGSASPKNPEPARLIAPGRQGKQFAARAATNGKHILNRNLTP